MEQLERGCAFERVHWGSRRGEDGLTGQAPGRNTLLAGRTVLRKALRLERVWLYLGAARRYWQKV